MLRELAGGFTLATRPDAEAAARRLLARPRTPPLTPAQAETLAIVAYLQPVSRPEIARIRGVSAESAAATLLERGLIEEAGRSQFGAVLYRTTPLFLKLFGLASLDDLPDPAQWDPDARRGGRAARAPAAGRRGAGGRRPGGGGRGLRTMRTLSEDLAERMRDGGDGRSDIWRAFADRELFARVVAALAAPCRGERYTKIAGIEARGFVLGRGRWRAHRRRLRRRAQGGRLAARRARRGRDRARLAGPHPRAAPAARRAGPRGPRRPRRRLVRDRAQALAARQLIEGTARRCVGMSIVVDDLSDEAREGLGRLHALLRADAL